VDARAARLPFTAGSPDGGRRVPGAAGTGAACRAALTATPVRARALSTAINEAKCIWTPPLPAASRRAPGGRGLPWWRRPRRRARRPPPAAPARPRRRPARPRAPPRPRARPAACAAACCRTRPPACRGGRARVMDRAGPPLSGAGASAPSQAALPSAARCLRPTCFLACMRVRRAAHGTLDLPTAQAGPPAADLRHCTASRRPPAEHAQKRRAVKTRRGAPAVLVDAALAVQGLRGRGVRRRSVVEAAHARLHAHDARAGRWREAQPAAAPVQHAQRVAARAAGAPGVRPNPTLTIRAHAREHKRVVRPWQCPRVWQGQAARRAHKPPTHAQGGRAPAGRRAERGGPGAVADEVHAVLRRPQQVVTTCKRGAQSRSPTLEQAPSGQALRD